MSAVANTKTCLFVTKDGRLSVDIMGEPIPEVVTRVRPDLVGAAHACALLGITPFRTFKRTVDGSIPVFEEE